MKKIIAMLLCVVMVAALGVNAFAASKLATHDASYYFKELVKGGTSSTNGYTRNYAAGLADAKKAASDAKDSATKTLKAVKDAAARLQNELLESAYKTLKAEVDVAVGNYVQEAYANYAYNYMKDVLDISHPTFAQAQQVFPGLFS